MEINIKPPSLKKFTETIKILDLVGIAAGVSSGCFHPGDYDSG